jgi:hypothetical protein
VPRASRYINNRPSTINPSRSQGVISSARRSAKAEVRGANPRESAILKEEGRMQNDETRPFASHDTQVSSFIILPSYFPCAVIMM